MKQKAEITFEQEETVILRQSAGHTIEFCPHCQETVEFLTPEIMAALVGASEREIFRLIESGLIHFVETERLYACSRCFAGINIETSVDETE